MLLEEVQATCMATLHALVKVLKDKLHMALCICHRDHIVNWFNLCSESEIEPSEEASLSDISGLQQIIGGG